MNLVETIAGGEVLGFYPQFEAAAAPQVRLWPTSSESSTMKRKQSHNAYERDRRKKMNALYSSLRSLLPQSENSKKLSIPNTVTKVLEYVPELQRHVERLATKKEEMMSRIRRERDANRRSGDGFPGAGCSSPLVSVADLGGGELAIQICALSWVGKKGTISTVMEFLESEGLGIVSASFIAVDASRSLLSLHCQVKDAAAKLDPGKLRMSLPAILR